MLSIDEEFNKINASLKSKQLFKIDGPFIIGLEKQENLIWIYNYEERRDYKIKDKEKNISILMKQSQ